MRGFSLVEVLVTLIIMAVGLLGIAKIQALAYSSTGVANLRSLAAIQASSLASAMHADRAYWAAVGSAPAVTTVNGTVISDPTLSTVPPGGVAPLGCVAAVGGPPPNCTPAQVAAADLQLWAQGLKAMLPSDSAAITCATATLPVTCTIQVQWTENSVAVNSTASTAAATNALNGNTAAFQTPTYTLYVEP